MFRDIGFLVLLTLFAATVAPADDGVTVGPRPSWVIDHPADLEAALPAHDADAPEHILLFEMQANDRARARYYGMTVRLNNAEGVDRYSDVVLSFNPAFEHLEVHEVTVIRDGRRIDKLADHDLRVLQREEAMYYGIYDGRLTALMNLTDMREGDVLVTAYTIVGRNPLLADAVLHGVNQQSHAPMHDLHLRVIVDPDQPVWQHARGGGQPLEELDTRWGREYRWHGHDLPAGEPDPYAPPGWVPFPRVVLTSYPDWAAVADWARPLYRVTDQERQELTRLVDGVLTGDDQLEQALAAIRFVQDDVRYLGREEGLWALRPRPPTRCFGERAGDCKEKSLLLVTLLDIIGVEAHPMLVSMAYGPRLAEMAPTPMAFDHCVVTYTLGGARFFIDPTASYQGGGVGGTAFADYGAGLVLAPGTRDLHPVPGPDPGRVEVTYHLDVDAMGEGGADFTVTSLYHGTMADARRGGIAGTSLRDLGRSNTQYYSQIFPGVEQTDPVEVLDDHREGDNIVTVVEHYRLNDVWLEPAEPEGRRQLELYPLEMEGVTSMAPSPTRTAPYDAGEAVALDLTIVVDMPEPFAVALPEVRIEGDGYEYSSQVTSEDATVTAVFHYSRTSREIAPENTAGFLRDHDRMSNDLGLVLFAGGEDGLAGGPSWPAIVLVLLSLGGFAALAIWLLRRYDPPAAVKVDRPRRIGGWLIIPAIGLILGGILEVAAVLGVPETFAAATWSAEVARAMGVEPSVWQGIMVLSMITMALHFVFRVAVAVAFYRRLTSAPRACVVYFGATALLLTLESVGMAVVASELVDADTVKETIQAWVGALIWVPYFLSSQRVQETFVFRRDGSYEQPEPLQEPELVAEPVDEPADE